jgi:Ca2+-binding RTX toxin-like protein
MARIISTEAFDERTFAFEPAVAALRDTSATVVGNAGNYRYGINSFDNFQSTLFNSGASRLIAYADDVTRNAAADMNAGTVGAILDQNLFGTRWNTTFALTNITGSATAYDAAIHSAGSADDRSFLFAQLGGNDLVLLSRFDDYLNARAGNDTIRSGYGEDTLFGDSGNDSIDGGASNDNLFGGNDNDRILGGSGNDILAGGDGIDFLRGGNGDDILTGSTGADTFYFSAGDDLDTITLFSQGTDRLQVSGMTAATVFTAVQQGADTLISFGSQDIQIVVQNTLAAQMTLADFIL